MIKTLDHLIVAVSDINEAEKNYSKVFGIDPAWRGEHTEYGTYFVGTRTARFSKNYDIGTEI